MRHAGTFLVAAGLTLVLVAAGSPARLAAADEPSAPVRVAAADESSRAVGYWRLWLTLRPRMQDAGVPVLERIDALNAFLANSPDEPWAEQPRLQAAALLEDLVREWRGQGTTPASAAPGAEPSTSPSQPWDVGRYDPDDDDALQGRIRADEAREPSSASAHRMLFDAVAFSYSAPAGFEAALGRLRWSTFQLQILAGGADWTGLVSEGQAWAGLIGVGARFPFGDDHANEIGFLVYPLSAEIYGTDTSDYEDDLGLGVGFVHSRLYYRHDFDGVALEAAVSMPLIFGARELFDDAPPIMLSLGAAFGRTR